MKRPFQWRYALSLHYLVLFARYSGAHWHNQLSFTLYSTDRDEIFARIVWRLVLNKNHMEKVLVAPSLHSPTNFSAQLLRYLIWRSPNSATAWLMLWMPRTDPTLSMTLLRHCLESASVLSIHTPTTRLITLGSIDLICSCGLFGRQTNKALNSRPRIHQPKITYLNLATNEGSTRTIIELSRFISDIVGFAFGPVMRSSSAIK